MKRRIYRNNPSKVLWGVDYLISVILTDNKIFYKNRMHKISGTNSDTDMETNSDAANSMNDLQR